MSLCFVHHEVGILCFTRKFSGVLNVEMVGYDCIDDEFANGSYKVPYFVNIYGLRS